MQNSEKQAEPSMEEILASIRKIIAEEPVSAQPAPVEQPTAPQPDVAASGEPASSLGPPSGDLSDILGEAASEQGGAAEPSASASASPATDWPFGSSRTGGAEDGRYPADGNDGAGTGDSVQTARETGGAIFPTAPLFTGGPEDQAGPTGGAETVARQQPDASEPAPEEPLLARLRGLEAAKPRFGSLESGGSTPTFREIVAPAVTAVPEAAGDGDAAAIDETDTMALAASAEETEVSGHVTSGAMEGGAGEGLAVESGDGGAGQLQDGVADGLMGLQGLADDIAAEDIVDPFGLPDDPAFNADVQPVAALPHTLGGGDDTALPEADIVAAEVFGEQGVSADGASFAPAVEGLVQAPVAAAASEGVKAEAVPVAAETPAASSPAIESALAELIRPIVLKWLDENGARLVEAAIEKKLADTEGE